jgi:hypothetical protein
MLEDFSERDRFSSVVTHKHEYLPNVLILKNIGTVRDANGCVHNKLNPILDH